MSSIVHVKDSLAPVIHGKFTLTSSGLIVDGAPTYEEWADLGGVLAVMERGIQFLVGDWITWGEATFGELAAQVIDARMWKPATVAVYAWLAKSVPLENRMLDRGLSVKHHQIVAALPPAQQRTWLSRALADDEPWTAARLAQAVKANGDVPATGYGIFVFCETKKEQQRLLKMLTLEGATCKATERRGAKA